jgi:hypothetical protein
MREKQNNPFENDRTKNESRQTDISSENIRNAHASGDGSLRRSDMSFPEKNERLNAGEEEQELEQNY